MRHLTRRDFIRSGLAAGAAFTAPVSRVLARSANEEIRLGFASCGGRAGELMNALSVERSHSWFTC